MTAPYLFLSHSGLDADTAREIKRRLLEALDAEGLTVWLDTDDLPRDSGRPWRQGIEEGISRSTAFGVIVGAHGIHNWVRVETDIALDRAARDPGYRFIPILVDGATESALDPFSRRFQAVPDPRADPENLQALLAAATGRTGDIGTLRLTDRPFPGLRSMDADWSDRFFGRKRETDEVLAMLRQEPAVVISADSGAGKSSLAMAGVGTAWRGGALRDDRPATEDPVIWNVITMRPLSDPVESLRMAVSKTAEGYGRSGDEMTGLRARIDPANPSESLYALECNLPTGQVRTLLIIDQAEELVTQTTDLTARAAFGDLIAGMLKKAAEGDRLRVVITARADYANLLETIDGLKPLMQRETARYRLKVPEAEAIAEMIRRPLHMAGFRDETEIAKLIDRVNADVSHQPGDLALAQMALHLCWRDRARHGSLLAAYGAMGNVAGALGKEAQRVTSEELTEGERARLMPIFIRLVRLGEATGATRRRAGLDEFSDGDRRLIDKLAGDDCGRLLMISEDSVEIAHEALITQWPDLHGQVTINAPSARQLGALIPRARDWALDRRKGRHLPSKADHEQFTAVRAAQGGWLIEREHRFIAWATAKFRNNLIASILGWIGITILATVTIIFYFSSLEVRKEAEEAKWTAMALLADIQLRENRPVEASLLALNAWPRVKGSQEHRQSLAIDVLSKAIPILRERSRFVLEEGSNTAMIGIDATHVVTGHQDGMIKIWNILTGEEEYHFGRYSSSVAMLEISQDRQMLAAGFSDGTVRVWKLDSRKEVANFLLPSKPIRIEFTSDGRRIIPFSLFDSAGGFWHSDDNIDVIVLDIDSNSQTVRQFSRQNGEMQSVAISPNGEYAIMALKNRSLQFYDLSRDGSIGETSDLFTKKAWFPGIFSPNGMRFASLSDTGQIYVWDVQSARELVNFGVPHDAKFVFTSDGNRVVIADTNHPGKERNPFSGTKIFDINEGKFSEDEIPFADLVLFKHPVISPDGSRFLYFEDNMMKLASLDGESILQIDGFSQFTRAYIWEDGSRVTTYDFDYSSGGRYVARVWDISTGSLVYNIGGWNGERDWAFDLDFSSDGRYIAVGSDQGVRIFLHSKNLEVASLEISGASVSSVAFSPNGNQLAFSTSVGFVAVWNWMEDEKFQYFIGHDAPVHSVAYSPNGMFLATGSSDKTARLWEVSTGREVAVYPHQDSVSEVAFSHHSGHLATGGGDGVARLWNSVTNEMVAEFKHSNRDSFRGELEKIHSLTFSQDGKTLAVTSQPNAVSLFDVESQRELALLEAHSGRDPVVDFSPDGTRLAIGTSGWQGSYGLTSIWDVASRREIVRLQATNSATNSVAYSPLDDGLIATTSVLSRHYDPLFSAFSHGISFWRISVSPFDFDTRLGVPPGDLFHIVCGWLPTINGKHAWDALEIEGVEIDSDICGFEDGYDPPLPN